MSADSSAPNNGSVSSIIDSNVQDMASMLLKMKEQQDVIEKLQKSNQEKEERINAANAGRRKEMQAVMEGMKQYISEMKEKMPEAEVDKIITGLETCVENGERNPIFEVMCCASNKDKMRVDELERIRAENEELKKSMHGGIFGSESARVGEKRSSDQITPASNENFWSTFEFGMR